MARPPRAARTWRGFPGDLFKPEEGAGFQQLFFDAIHKHLPQISATLRDEVLPIYSDVVRQPDYENLPKQDAGGLPIIYWDSRARLRLRSKYLASSGENLYPNLIP